MLVNKIEFIPTVFEGIQEVISNKTVDLANNYIISNKIDVGISLRNICQNDKLDFEDLSGPNNLLNLWSEIRSYYSKRFFTVPNGFKIDQKYLNKILAIIEEKWDDTAVKIAIASHKLGFHEIQKIVKEKNGIIVKSWEELEKENLLNIIEFKHVKENMQIIKNLFLYYLTGEDIISTREYIHIGQHSNLLALLNKDGFFTYKSPQKYIDKFECTVGNTYYLCDYNGVKVTMYPNVRDLMDNYEIKRFHNTALTYFGCNELIVATSLEHLNQHKIHIDYDYYNHVFRRKKSTSSLFLGGISSSAFSVDFRLTAEEVKSLLAKFGQKKTGLKHEVMERLGQLCQDLSVKYEDKLKEYFNSNMVIKVLNHSNISTAKIQIEGLDDSIVYFVLYVYIKNRTKGSALFLKDELNGLYNAANDFSRKDEQQTIQFMRTNERIT